MNPSHESGSEARRLSQFQDTTDILSKMLSFSEPDIARLYDEKVVHRTEPFTTPQIEAVNP